jgi:hypothetical protein
MTNDPVSKASPGKVETWQSGCGVAEINGRLDEIERRRQNGLFSQLHWIAAHYNKLSK